MKPIFTKEELFLNELTGFEKPTTSSHCTFTEFCHVLDLFFFYRNEFTSKSGGTVNETFRLTYVKNNKYGYFILTPISDRMFSLQLTRPQDPIVSELTELQIFSRHIVEILNEDDKKNYKKFINNYIEY